MTGVRFYEWLCMCVFMCVQVNGCSLALMTIICIMDSHAILRQRADGKIWRKKKKKESVSRKGFSRVVAQSKSDLTLVVRTL